MNETLQTTVIERTKPVALPDGRAVCYELRPSVYLDYWTALLVFSDNTTSLVSNGGSSKWPGESSARNGAERWIKLLAAGVNPHTPSKDLLFDAAIQALSAARMDHWDKAGSVRFNAFNALVAAIASAEAGL